MLNYRSILGIGGKGLRGEGILRFRFSAEGRSRRRAGRDIDLFSRGRRSSRGS